MHKQTTPTYQIIPMDRMLMGFNDTPDHLWEAMLADGYVQLYLERMSKAHTLHKQMEADLDHYANIIAVQNCGATSYRSSEARNIAREQFIHKPWGLLKQGLAHELKMARLRVLKLEETA